MKTKRKSRGKLIRWSILFLPFFLSLYIFILIFSFPTFYIVFILYWWQHSICPPICTPVFLISVHLVAEVERWNSFSFFKQDKNRSLGLSPYNLYAMVVYSIIFLYIFWNCISYAINNLNTFHFVSCSSIFLKES